jgi:hypothetical protein
MATFPISNDLINLDLFPSGECPALPTQGQVWPQGLFFGSYAGVATPTDPYWNNVSLLLPMTGTNGSTIFTDASINTLPVTTVGNTQISTAQSPFADGSGYFDGTGDYLSVPNTGGVFDFGSGDFTVETFIRLSTLTGIQVIVGNISSPSNATWRLAVDDSKIGFGWFTTAPSFIDAVSSTGVLTTGSWIHVAVCRAGSSFTVYADGISVASATSAAALRNATANLNIGRNEEADIWYMNNAYAGQMRITKGVARYTANFTPPTAPFPTS